MKMTIVVPTAAAVLVGALGAPAAAQADRSIFCDPSHSLVEELAIFETGPDGTGDMCSTATAVSSAAMSRIHRDGIDNPSRFPHRVRVRSGTTYRIKWSRATHPVYGYKHWIASAPSGRTLVRWSIDDVGVLGDY
jgi:hypothetical protein